MKLLQRHLLLATSLLLSVVALGLVAGCSSASKATAPTASPDPLVGTWRHQWLVGDPPPDPPLIITKAGDGYLATFVYSGEPDQTTPSPSPTVSVPLRWQSAVLVGPNKVGTFIDGRVQVAVVDTGKLLWSTSTRPNGPFSPSEVWVKVSTGTAYPSP